VVIGVMPLITFTTAWEGKWLVKSYGLDPAKLGHYLIAGPLLFDVGAFLFGDLASRRIRKRSDGSPPRLLFATAAVLIIVGDLSAAYAPSALAAIGWNALAAVGRGAILPLVISDLARRLPPELVAPGGAAFNGIQALVMVVANILIGYVVQHYGYRAIIVGITLWVALPCLVWLATIRPRAASLPKARVVSTRDPPT
jgi:MFS family permease